MNPRILLLLLLLLTSCAANPVGRPVFQHPSGSPSTQPHLTLPAIQCSGAAEMDRPVAVGVGPHHTISTTSSRSVALTFDDGPDPINTPRILNLLRQCGVKATFCVNGEKVQKYPDVVRLIYQDGHTICNHTWKHLKALGSMGRETIRDDLRRTNSAIRAVVPEASVSYFRAPYGEWTRDYVAVAQELDMVSLHWDFDTHDWDRSKYGFGQPMVDHIVQAVKQKVRPGSVILAHDNEKPDTTAALRILLPWLKARFSLVAMPPDVVVLN